MPRNFLNKFHLMMRTMQAAGITYRVLHYRCGLKAVLKWFLQRSQTPTSIAALEEVRLELLSVRR